MCHFKALCAVKYDGGYERARGRERERGERARDSWCGAAFDVCAGSELNAELTEGEALVSWCEYEAGCAVRVSKKKRKKHMRLHLFFPPSNAFTSVHRFLSSSMSVHFAPERLVCCPSETRFIASPSCHSLVRGSCSDQLPGHIGQLSNSHMVCVCVCLGLIYILLSY